MTLPTRTDRQSGASLIEVLVALVVTTVGMLSMATLIGYGTTLQRTSRDTTLAASAGRQQIERLRMLPPLAPARAVGGSLTADAANHFAVVTNQTGTFRCRWQVTAGPSSTKQVRMVVLRDPSTAVVADLEVSVWP